MHGTIAGVGRRASAAGRIAALSVVLASAGLGCAPSTCPFIAQGDARITIEVMNHAFQDATLHAVWSGRRVRLGRVIGTRTANYILPWDRSFEFRIEIDLLAGPDCLTRGIWADPGDIIVLEIQSDLRLCGW